MYYSTKTEEKADTKQKINYESFAFGYIEDCNTIISKGQAYQYNGTHYVPVHKLKINLRKWMRDKKIAQSNSFVDNVYPILEAYATTDYDQPCWNDGTKEKIIPFKNGLMRLEPFLKTGEAELLKHTANYQSTWCVPADYDPKAECPTWLNFLSECLENEADQIALAQEWFGYVLSGDTSRQVYMTHVGAKGSGKSTMARILEKLMGDGYTGFNLRQLAGRFGLAGLQGRSLAVCGEVELAGCKERAEITERLKSITGNDTQQIERKGDNVFPSLVLPVRFHLIANTMPVLRDASLALARRMLVLWSPSSAVEVDYALEEKLVAEMPGIVRWALEGLQRLQKAGKFTTTTRMTSEMGAIRREASPAIAFLQDKCEVHHSLGDDTTLTGVKWVDGTFWTPRADIWASAVKWAEENQIDLPDSPSWFWRDMRATLPRMSADRVQKRVGDRLIQAIEGIRLKS